MFISLPQAAVAVKAVQTATNLESVDPANFIIDLTAANLLGKPGNSISPALANTPGTPSAKDQYISGKIEGHFKQKNLVVLDAKVGPVAQKDGANTQTMDLATVDKRYLEFGHCEDVFNALKRGEIPSSRAVYLAILDIADAMDLGLFGDRIQAARIQDNIVHHKVSVTEKTEEKVSEEKGKEQKLDTDGKKVMERDEVTHRHTEMTTEVKVDDKKIAEVKSSTDTDEHQKIRTERNERSWGEAIFGNDEQVTTTTTASVEGKTRIIGTAEGADGKLESTVLDEQSISETGPSVSNTAKEWRSGFISYVPLGSVADAVGKMNAGYNLTWGDALMIGIDSVGTACTLGVGTSLIKVGGTAAVKASGTAVAKAGSKAGAQITAKAATRLGPAELSTAKAIKNQRMSKLVSENFRGAELVAHNPNKPNIWKSLADCSKIEKAGGDVKSFIKSCTPVRNKLASMNAHGMESMYCYARRYGLTTPKNLKRMEQGLAPKFMDGTVAHLDHIVQVKHAPELKTIPANLRILKPIENLTRNAGIDRHCRNKVKVFQKNTLWEPNQSLQDAINAFH